MNDLFRKAAADLSAAKQIVALTGAGISVESGIPPFRGKGGLWEKFDPMEYAHVDAFMKTPGKVWEALFKGLNEVLKKAEPNEAHLGLARLETLGKEITVITQNVDGLHQAAGNTDVIEFHGTFARHYCQDCGEKFSADQIDLTFMPPKCVCGGVIRPDCVLFGEMIRPELLFRSRMVSSECQLMLVIGTSAVVQPAAMMPIIAKNAGAKVIEINPEVTPLTAQVSDYLVQGPAARVMANIMTAFENT